MTTAWFIWAILWSILSALSHNLCLPHVSSKSSLRMFVPWDVTTIQITVTAVCPFSTFSKRSLQFPSPESESAQQRISGSVPWPAALFCVRQAPGTPPREFLAPPLWSWCSLSEGSVRWCWCSAGGPGRVRGPGSCSSGPWCSQWWRCGCGSLTSRSPCCAGSWGGRWGRRVRWSVWRTWSRWEGKLIH